ncbi:MAG: serine acetyltransferase [Algoriphagus sp.]|uniref:serine O-acetyltransferase n=1 Tax=Algoriphagus sp. TaxID=1872435 RepID=UPI0017B36CEA|nr:serine acetyltransferase [Algoriphagus sp.]NVJ86777.1 serine acetyltransferase [Algoriphagus sp.]
MINSKEELKFYLEADKFALGRKGKPWFFGDEVWKYQILLRKCEFYSKRRGFLKVLYLFFKYKRLRLGVKLGFDIPEGVFGAGLRINHFGNITVNGKCKIGRWCDIHQGVNIGASNPEKREEDKNYTPIIGDNVWIGPGAKIFGDIRIGSGVQIGANAVVNKSFQGNVTIGGIPASVIINKGTLSVDVLANSKNSKEFFKKFPKYQKFQ